MDFNYKIFGKIAPNSNASAMIHRKEDRVDIYLHPRKCGDCGSFFNDVENQMINALNHEVQESLMVEIMLDENSIYKKEWYDKTAKKFGGDRYEHKCRRSWFIVNNLTLSTNGYIR